MENQRHGKQLPWKERGSEVKIIENRLKLWKWQQVKNPKQVKNTNVAKLLEGWNPFNIRRYSAKKKKSLNMLKRNVFTSVCFAVFVLQPDLYLITTFLTFQSTQCMRPLVNCADIFLYVGLRKQPDKTKQMCCYSFAFSIVTASTCRLLCFLVEL